MPLVARFSHEGDEHVDFRPTVDVAAGTPTELSSGYWGVPSIDVRANTVGVFRVSGVFRGLKVNPAASYGVGDQLAYVTGGFESGSGPWRVREVSPAGSTTVAVEINPSGLSSLGGSSAAGYATMYWSDHGLTGGDIGKAVYAGELMDDTDPAHYFTGVVVSISDADNFVYAKEGDTTSLPASRIAGSYSYTSESRFLYWDLSLSGWAKSRPADSIPDQPAGVLVNSYNSTAQTYNVTVLGYGKLP